MLRVTCPNCQSRLAAREELIGQTRKCPYCDSPILITAESPNPDSNPPQAIPLDEATDGQHVVLPAGEALGVHAHRPLRLARTNRYLIFDRERILATWENNGHGWLVRTGTGFASVSRNLDKLPSQGMYEFVELRLGRTPTGVRLHGILAYRLANRWALPELARGEDAILRKVEGFGSLNRAQKYALGQYVREQFMREVWASINEVQDYLSNADYHSHGIDVPLEPI